MKKLLVLLIIINLFNILNISILEKRIDILEDKLHDLDYNIFKLKQEFYRHKQGVVMIKLKLYLSGAITGRENYEQEFYEAKEKLIKFQEDNNKRKDTENIDLDIIVPCDYDHLNKSGKWEDYLKNNIKLLVDCDCLIDIKNESYNSKGVLLEKMICIALGIPIISLSSFLNYKANYKYSTTNMEVK